MMQPAKKKIDWKLWIQIEQTQKQLTLMVGEEQTLTDEEIAAIDSDMRAVKELVDKLHAVTAQGKARFAASQLQRRSRSAK